MLTLGLGWTGKVICMGTFFNSLLTALKTSISLVPWFSLLWIVSRIFLKFFGYKAFFEGLLVLVVFWLSILFLINSIFIFGLIIYLVEAFKENYFLKLLTFFKNFKKIYLLFLIPISLLIITSVTSINPEAYNINDDYQKYFVLHPPWHWNNSYIRVSYGAFEKTLDCQCVTYAAPCWI